MTHTKWFAAPAAAILALTLALGGCTKADDSKERKSTSPASSGGGDCRATQPETPGLVVIDIQLPRAAFKGTPKDIPPGSTAEKPSDKPRPPFLAPVGVVNVALGKSVTCSDRRPLGEPSQVTDGDKEADEGCQLIADKETQYVQIDLGAEYEMYAIVVWFYHGQMGRIYKDVIVTVSEDPDFITVTRLFNNDFDNSSGQGAGEDREFFDTRDGKLIDARKTHARHVRVYANGSTADPTNQFTEVEVYGLPVTQ